MLKVARLLDVPPQRCVALADAVAGVEAARRAGMKRIAVDRLDAQDANAFQGLMGS